MNGTVEVNGEHAENGVNGSSNILSFKQPTLALKSFDEQIELLLLSWILLLYRGSGSSEDDGLSWGYRMRGGAHSSLPPHASGLITDFITGDQEHILGVLERVRKIGSDTRSSGSEKGDWKGLSIVLSNTSALESETQIVCDLRETQISAEQNWS